LLKSISPHDQYSRQSLFYFNDLGELWKSNGTAAGTVRIADLYSIKVITNVNGVAYIVAENESNGLELW
jgi:hypothetical protein